MPSPVRPVELRSVLNRWDQAARPARERILHEFVQKNHSRTAPELESEFKNGASLFLTRLCAYLKTSVTSKGSVGMTLQAISVFIAAASGNRFLNEFLDVGGLKVVVDVLGDDRGTENDRLRALQLLSATAACGSRYKKMILETELGAVPAICKFATSTESGPVQELSRIVLVNLGQSSSSSEELQENLILLLQSSKPQVQRTGSQILRQLLSPLSVEGASPLDPIPKIVEAVSGMFSSVHAHIMFESLELAASALIHPSTRREMVQRVTTLLRPDSYSKPPDGSWNRTAALLAANGEQASVPTSMITQAAAARLIAHFLKSKDEEKLAARETVLNLFVDCGVIGNLLVALANTDYSESKKQGLEALRNLLKWSASADAQFLSLVGTDVHSLFHADPTGCSQEMDYPRMNALLRSTNHASLQFFRIGEDADPVFEEEMEGDSRLEVDKGLDHEGRPAAFRQQFQQEK